MKLLALFAGIAAMVSILSIALFILNLLTAWKVFEKYGEPGWKGIIPFYSTYVESGYIWTTNAGLIMILGSLMQSYYENHEVSGFSVFLALVVGLGYLLLRFLYSLKKSQAFGKSMGMCLLLFFLPFIGNLVIGFDSTIQYVGNPENMQ